MDRQTPDNVHLLIGEPSATRLKDIFRAFKTQTSK